MNFDVRFAGVGGQGAVTAGRLLAEAVTVDGQWYAAQTAAYGAAVRDGPAVSNVRVSDAPVIFPWVVQPDCLVAFHQSALDAHVGALKPGGVLVVDPLLVTKLPVGLDAEVHGVRITELAQEAGHRVVGNIVALAAVARITRIVSRQAVEHVAIARAPKGTERLNRRALDLAFGLDLSEAMRGEGVGGR